MTSIKTKEQVEMLGKKYAIRACRLCGGMTHLRPIGVNFLDKDVDNEQIEGVKLPKILSYRDALEKADSVHKVCYDCHSGEPILKEDMHYWLDDE